MIINPIKMKNLKKLVDSYSMLVVSKYFESINDYVNVICVCKKFKETTEKLRFNPISITSLKLFPKIQTQYLYDQNDKKLDIIEHQEIWYEVDYEEYLKYKENNIKCHHITYTSENRKNYGDIIPDEVTTLDKKCYYNLLTVQTLIISKNISVIGAYCFKCSSIQSVTISSTITKLENGLFFGCHNLSTIKLPKTLTSIGMKCFSYCVSLITITLPSTLKTIGYCCFSGCSNLISINGVEKLELGLFCFNGCDQLKIKPESLLKK